MTNNITSLSCANFNQTDYPESNRIKTTYVAGINSNACAIVSLTATHNGNWGIYDNSALGNTYMGCHSERNGTGAYITGLAGGSDVNRNLFIGCTGEGHVLVENPSQWIGGSSEQVPYYFPSGVWKNEASTLQQGGIFPLYRQVVRFRNSTGIVADPEAGVAGDSGVFFEVGPNAPEDLFGFGIVTRDWAMSVKMLDNIVSGKSKYYAFNEANADAGIALSLSGLLTGGEIPHGMPYFFNPILMSKNDEEGEKKIRITVGEGKPIGEAVHVDGIPITVINPLTELEVQLIKIIGNVGDLHFNSKPTLDANTEDVDILEYVAWICTDSFIFNVETPTASVEAIWKPFWLINPL